jgi:hypothetical protein
MTTEKYKSRFRKLQKATLRPEQYRAKRNAECAERLQIATRRRQEEHAA